MGYSARFMPAQRPDKQGRVAIYLQAVINRKIVRINTGIKVGADKFNAATEKITIPDKDLNTKYTAIMHSLKGKAENIFADAINMQRPLDTEEFKRQMTSRDDRRSFISFMEQEIRKANLSPNTARHYQMTLRALKNFKPALTFSDINIEFVEAFEKMLRAKKLNPNSRGKHHICLRTHINRALRSGHFILNPYGTGKFRIPAARVDREYLTKDEVAKLVALYDSNTLSYELQRVLRVFLFMCHCGIRISDTLLLTHDSIIDGIAVFQALKTQQTKTLSRVPLGSTAIKYISTNTKELFPGVKTSQVINRHLKSICNYAGISKRVSCHTARHTYSTLYLESGGDLASLQRVLGHADAATTFRYLHTSMRVQVGKQAQFDSYMNDSTDQPSV
jgi:site-specific recombinase XerD